MENTSKKFFVITFNGIGGNGKFKRIMDDLEKAVDEIEKLKQSGCNGIKLMTYNAEPVETDDIDQRSCDLICPHCGIELTNEQVLELYADYCSRHLKGRTSEKKRASSAENGKKGGRPRKNWFVANNDGDIIGHDMTKAKAEALAEEMKSKEPDAEWEAMSE